MIKLDNIRKIFMIGDLHLGIRNSSTVWNMDMIKFLNTFLDNLPRHGFDPDKDILMLTGDIFHSREFLNVMIMHNVIKVFDRITNTFTRGVYGILGNHDFYALKTNKIHTLEFMVGLFPNMTIFSEADVLSINGNINFLMLPWYDKKEDIEKLLTENTDCEYLFSHMDTAGFKYNKTIQVDGGIPRELLKRFKRAYIGHLHHKQESGNVLYLGTPYQMDRGDSETQRGYYVVTITDDILQEEYHENTWSPKFVAYEFDDIMNMSYEQAMPLLNNNYVDIRIPISAARNFQFGTFSDAMSENNIQPKKLEFKQYDDSYAIDESDYNVNVDFNFATTAKLILEEKKYTHTEADSVLSYFNDLYTLARNNQKEQHRVV